MTTKPTSIVLVIVSSKESDAVSQWHVPEIMIASVVPVERIILAFVSNFFPISDIWRTLSFVLADQCSDGYKDANEIDVDCAGDCLAKGKRCSVTMICTGDNDCISAACGKNGTCVRKCFVLEETF